MLQAGAFVYSDAEFFVEILYFCTLKNQKDDLNKTNMNRTVIVDALKRKDFGAEVNIKGWVRTRRGNKNVSFIALNDGSTIHNIQVVADNSTFGDEYLKPITTGACISVTGKLVESLGQGQNVEIQAEKIEIYGTADSETYPLQKKGHSMEFMREIAHLRFKEIGIRRIV